MKLIDSSSIYYNEEETSLAGRKVSSVSKGSLTLFIF